MEKQNIFYYQNTNFYEGGQIYRTIALENKANKISVTAIKADDCYIGKLTRKRSPQSPIPIFIYLKLMILFNIFKYKY